MTPLVLRATSHERCECGGVFAARSEGLAVLCSRYPECTRTPHGTQKRKQRSATAQYVSHTGWFVTDEIYDQDLSMPHFVPAGTQRLLPAVLTVIAQRRKAHVKDKRSASRSILQRLRT